uniref:Uncharacterized protein n=1 Tax=Periophthalmus magnuspinnatus TaxID=409849 RepID=A0A3B4AH85_9GOBI
MATTKLEILVVALVIGFIGLIGVAAVTGLPMWKVTAFIEENIIVMETRWEGLWMNCYRQANIRMQCKVYDSLLFLPPDLQAARGLMCSSVAVTTIALIVSAVGMKCTKAIDHRARTKHIVLVVGGSLFLLGCVTTLIPVSWTGHVIIRDFYNPLLIDAQRRELGEALYIGWVTSALLFTSGVILLCRSEKEGSERYLYSRNSDYITYSPQQLQPQQLVFLPQPQPQLQPRTQPMLSRHPSANYSHYSLQSHHSNHQPSRYPSVRSGVAYL